MNTFGIKLKSLRESAGLRQHELAKMASISQCVVSQLETGRHSPKWETVCALADALKISTEKFRQR